MPVVETIRRYDVVSRRAGVRVAIDIPPSAAEAWLQRFGRMTPTDAALTLAVAGRDPITCGLIIIRPRPALHS